MTAADATEADLAFAVAAAAEAGRRLLRLRESGRWEGRTLGDVADHAADGFLQGLVRGRYPDDGLLSEETRDSRERLARRRAWIVDPLDGTREYTDGRHDWAVHVALAVEGRPAVGAVALPVEGRVLWGVPDGAGARAGVEGGGELRDASGGGDGRLRLVVSRSHTPEWVPRLAEALGGAELVAVGSVGFKVSRLLLGEADVYVHQVGLKEWDTCAPEAVARACGWSVSRLDGAEQRYNGPDPRNDQLVVCRPSDRERVLAAVAEALGG